MSLPTVCTVRSDLYGFGITDFSWFVYYKTDGLLKSAVEITARSEIVCCFSQITAGSGLICCFSQLHAVFHRSFLAVLLTDFY